jgi:hypothetical protein
LTSTGPVLLTRDGASQLRGDPLPVPAGSTVDQWLDVAVSRKGELGTSLDIRRADGAELRGVYLDATPVWLQGAPVAGPFIGPGSRLGNSGAVRLGDEAVFVLGDIRNTTWPGARDQALVRFDLDEDRRVTGSEVLLTDGMYLPGLRMISFGNFFDGPGNGLAVNRKGHFILQLRAAGLRSEFGDLRSLIALDLREVLAIERGPSPVAGRRWSALLNSAVAINDRSEHAYSGFLTGPSTDTTRYLIVRNGEKFVQSGDVLPLLQDEPVEWSNASQFDQLHLSDDGDLFWWAPGENAAYMRNDTPVLQRLKTVVEGRLVVNTIGRFAVSPDGRFLVCRAQLLGDHGFGEEALVMVEFD